MKSIIRHLLSTFFILCFITSFTQKPIVFKIPDSNEPGNVIMLYGGNLDKTETVRYSKLLDGSIETPGKPLMQLSTDAVTAKALQVTDASLKFQLASAASNGLFAVQINASKENSNIIILNKPEIWFAQPVKLSHELLQNQVIAGTQIQLVGKNILLPKDIGTPSIALKKIGTANWQTIKATKAERFSLWVSIPTSLTAGSYEIAVHNGFGGVYGWSELLNIEIKNELKWNEKIFNVKKYGALGDDKNDDTKAIKDALVAASENGGGTVYFPWGTYRLSGWLCIPPNVTLKGDSRDGTQLKWPLDEPKSLKDFSSVAVYGVAPFTVENLTFMVRKYEHILVEINANINTPDSIKKYLQPWGAPHDVFLRNVNFQHLLLASHPERQAVTVPELNKKYWRDGAINFKTGNIKNLEISDCLFEGGNNMFYNIKNARITNNSFSNTMGYCWTVLGGGANYVVCSNNEINASSSWGYGNIGMQYIYSAHNISRNFVTGEREAMTLDISALPTSRPTAQYWGTPVEIGNDSSNVYAQFPPKNYTNKDGFATGFTPGSFKGGTLYVRAYNGGKGGGQKRTIIDNTEDKVLLDKPFKPLPDTLERKMYIELAPRFGNGNTAAWFGKLKTIKGTLIRFNEDATFIPAEFEEKAVMILDGKGVGQYREIISNNKNEIILNKPFDIEPDTNSKLGIWSLMRHMVVYKSEGYDCSAFAQLWGSFYDYTIDECKVERNQGVWAQSGWFINFRYNQIAYGTSYHPGIGPRGSNPEKNVNFSFVGLMSGDLRVTKWIPYYYSDTTKIVMVDKIFGEPVAGGRGIIIKSNQLSFNQRIAMPPTDNPNPNMKAPTRFIDVVIDKNTIEKSSVGIQLGPESVKVISSNNKFIDVAKEYLIAKPEDVIILDKK